MNNPEILEEIKQLNLVISNAMNEVVKGQNIPFFKALIQQNAIDIYQKASMLEDKQQSNTEEKKPSIPQELPEKEKPEISEPVKQEVHEEPVQVVRKTEIPVTKPVETNYTPATPPKVKTSPESSGNERESLNDKISKNKQPVMNVADKSKGTPISDLVKSIPIGKKFEFINGLFDGNSDVYKTSIHNIQNASSYEEAAGFLESNITGPYEWDANEELAAEFFGLIKRRFS